VRIHKTDIIKYLGVIIRNKLSWKWQIGNLKCVLLLSAYSVNMTWLIVTRVTLWLNIV